MKKKTILLLELLVFILLFGVGANKKQVKAMAFVENQVQNEACESKEDSEEELNLLLSMNDEERSEFLKNENYCGAANSSAATVITSPLNYLRKNIGKPSDTYSVTSKIISGVSNATCSEFSDKNNCTIVALYNLMVYYRKKGYTKISSSKYSLYNKIKKEAKNLGYTPSRGFGFTKNNDLVTNVWKSYKYKSGSGSSTYFWNKNTIISYLDKNKPFIFSLASGYYYSHSIAVYGYKTYRNKRTGNKYKFLVVSDGWSSGTRYMAWSNTGEGYIGMFTTINKP